MLSERCAQVGDTFVLNCLGEGQYGPLMKVRSPLLQHRTAGSNAAYLSAILRNAT